MIYKNDDVDPDDSFVKESLIKTFKPYTINS